ncbi:Uma2 family endonuclease [Streptomyces nondiastaticus]|uniref:Uma2 family endonuclease n=1 Tax=Streptomyces nondiastaticus TaxID=3154512 RepID=UPI00341E63EC
MSSDRAAGRRHRAYSADDPETALKYALQCFESDQVQLVEGVITLPFRRWDDDTTARTVRDRIAPALDRMGCVTGSGDLDLPGSLNWYVPDLAVVPEGAAQGAGALLPEETLLVVEVTSDPGDDTDRVTKRRRYAEYGAPLYLLVDRHERTCTLFSRPGEPGEPGYMKSDSCRFGESLHLPEPFGLALDTSEF